MSRICSTLSSTATMHHLLLLALLIPASRGGAQETANVGGNSGVRRAYVRTSDLTNLVKGHIPIRESELHELLDFTAADSIRSTRCESAFYSAKFVDGQLVDGKAELQLNGSERRIGPIDFDDCRLAWKPVATDSSVRFGTDQFGSAVLIPGDQENVVLHWSLSSEELNSGSPKFEFYGIRSPFNRLQLDVPERFEVSSSRGLVEVEKAAPEPGYRRWLVKLGGYRSTQLAMLPTTDSNAFKMVIVNEQSTRHVLSSQGTEIVSTLSISNPNATANQLQFTAPDHLQIVRMLWGNRETGWDRLVDTPGELPRYNIALPASEDVAILQIFASAEMQSGQVHKLPDVVPINVLWNRRLIEAVVPSHLEIGAVTLNGCRWRDRTTQEGDQSRLLQWDILQDSGTVSFAWFPAATRVAHSSTTHVTLSPERTSATVDIELIGQSGNAYELRPPIHSAWSIENVRAEPAEALDSWSVESVDRQRFLSLRFAIPLTSQRKVRVFVSAQHAKIAAGATFDGDLAEVVSLGSENSVITRREFVAETPLRLMVENDDAVMPLEGIDSKSIGEDTASFDSENATDYAYEAHAGIDAPSFRLQRGNIPWSASIIIDNFVRDGRNEESWSIECGAESDVLHDVTIRLTPSASCDAQWFADADHLLPLAATRINQVAAGDEPPEHDVYRISLPKLAAGRRTIFGARTRPLNSGPSTPLGIVTAPAAKSQGAILTVRADRITANRIREIQSSLDSVTYRSIPTENATTLAAFRYDANSEIKLPAIVFHDSQEHDVARSAGAWIQHAQVLTRIAATGERWHELRLDIRNRELNSIAITMPTGATVQRLFVDDTPSANLLNTTSTGHSTVTIPLGFDRTSRKATIEFHESGSALGAHATLSRPEWRADAPVMSREWIVETPRRFSTYPASSLRDGTSLAARFFGPFAVRAENWTPEFAPLHALPPATERLYIVPNQLIAISAWVLFLLMVAASWARVVPQRYLFVMIAVGMVLATLSPMPFFQLGTAVVWSIPLGFALRCFPKSEKAGHALLATTALRILVLATFASWTAQAAAQDDTTDAFNDPIQIIIPYDDVAGEESNAANQVVYVPTSQYEELVRSSLRRTGELAELIEDVTYRATFTKSTPGIPVEVTTIVAEYKVQVFDPGVEISIPIGPGARERCDNRLTWNGVPLLDATWNGAGDHLVLPPNAAGVHVLRAELTPIRGSRGSWLGLSLPVSPHPTAKLIVDRSVDQELRLQVEHAVGSVETTVASSVNSDQVVAQLGPCDAIEIRWQESANATVQKAIQLCHLTASPGLLRLKMRISSPDAKPLRRLKFRLPKELRWIAPAGVLTQTQLRADGDIELFVEWPADVAIRDDIEFLLEDSFLDQEINLMIPEVTGLKFEQRILAIQNDKRFGLMQSPDGATIDTDDFRIVWPEAPQFDALFRIPIGQTQLSISVLERSSRQVADERNMIHFGKRWVELNFRAVIAPLEGRTFQHVLRVPDRFEVQGVALSDKQPVGWSSHREGYLYVLSNAPVTGPHELFVRGRLALKQFGEQSLPLVHLDSAVVNQSTASISRSEDVELRLASLGSFAPASSIQTGFSSAADHKPISVLESTGSVTPPKVEVQSNEAKLSARMLTTMHANGNDWFSSVECIFDVDTGFRDSVSFEIPDNWGDDLQIVPQANWEVYRLPDRRRRLKVWLPVDEKQQLRMTMTARMSTSQGVQLPKIRPMFTDEVTAWVALPGSIEQRELDWVTRRLVTQAMPREFTPRSNCVTYRAIGRLAAATLRTTEQGESQAVLPLLLASITMHDDTCEQRYRFFVRPQGLGSLAIQLPTGTQLIAMEAAGRIASVAKRQDNLWQIHHLPTDLPYMLDVRCISSHPANRNTNQIACPRLIGCDAKQVFWEVQASRLPPSKQVDSIAAFQELKLRAFEQFLSLPAESASSATPNELEAWNTLWTAEIIREFKIIPAAAALAANPQSAIDIGRRRLANLPALSIDADGWTGAIGGNSIVLTTPKRRRRSLQRITLTLLAIMLPLWLSRPNIWEIFQRYLDFWLPGLLIATGFAWLIWLIPAWFGLFFIAFGMRLGAKSFLGQVRL